MTTTPGSAGVDVGTTPPGAVGVVVGVVGDVVGAFVGVGASVGSVVEGSQPWTQITLDLVSVRLAPGVLTVILTWKPWCALGTPAGCSV